MKENVANDIKEAKDDVENYVNAKIDMIKLHVAENLSRIVSGMIIKMVLAVFLVLITFFVSMAGAVWIDHIYSNSGIGFIIVAAFYLVLSIIFILLRRKIITKPIIQSFIQLFFPSYSDYDDSEN